MKSHFPLWFALALSALLNPGASAAPHISSISPNPCRIGGELTIKGSGFSADIEGNVVFIGPVRAPVIGATATSLSVRVEPGSSYAPVTVAVGGLTAYSPVPLVSTFGGSGMIIATSFAHHVDFVAEGNLRAGTIADLDGDGKPDIVSTNDMDMVSIFLNKTTPFTITTSSFAGRLDVAVGKGPCAVEAGDFDGDGKLDLAVACTGDSVVTILRNTSTPGSLSFRRQDFGVPGSPHDVSVRDMDGDGRPDIVVTGTRTCVLRNTSSGSVFSFATPVTIDANESRANLTADVDGDGMPDIVVVKRSWGGLSTVRVFRNVSVPDSLRFEMAGDFPLGPDGEGLAAGDLDGDGSIDIVATSGMGESTQPKLLSVFRNTSSVGAVSFAPRIDFASLDSTARSVRLGDLDGDGKLDMVVPYSGVPVSVVSVYRNSSAPGNITFDQRVNYETGSCPWDVTVGDMDMDGKPDLVCHLFCGRGISVLRSNVGNEIVDQTRDTVWINPATPGALEKTINQDVTSGGARAHPYRTYGLRKDMVYIQNEGIVFTGGTTLSIIGEKGGAYPVVQMQPVNGLDPGVDLPNGIANKIEGSLNLDHVYWIGKATDGTQYNQLFGMTTVNNLSQMCRVNDCITEFIGMDTFNGDGWTHGSIWKFTNCYFRALFSGQQWWGGRLMYCKKPIDTIWVENCTVTNGGLIFLQQEAVCRFAFFNHNTFINTNKYWLMNGYYVNLFVCNNLFTNENWVGEDSVNVATGWMDPDGSPGHPMYMGTISVDTITIRQQLFADMIRADSTADQTKVGFNKMRIFVSNNICWTDTLLNSYYRNYNNHWNNIGPYPLSYLNWAGYGTGPWPVVNIPGIWANKRTMALFDAYRWNMTMSHNIFTKIDTKTPSIENAGIVELMGQWNQNQWNDPAWPVATDALLMSSYVPGDKNAATLPGFTNGVKDENGQTSGVAKVSDFIENYDQAGTPVNSTIDGLPIGALHWHDATVPASSYAAILASFSRVVYGIVEPGGVAESFKLDQNYPNPFNPSTTIRYALPAASHVVLTVYNTLGQEVTTLVNEVQGRGSHSVILDGTGLASGVYLYRIQAANFVDTKKLVLLR